MNYVCKTILAGCLLMLMVRQGKAQTIVHIGEGGQLFISAKTAVSFDSLVMVPASNGFLLGENDISKLANPNNPFPQGTYLQRVYCFSHPVPDYSGSLAIFYTDKEAENTDVRPLLVQAYTGYAWHPLRDDKVRNAQRNGVGVLGVHHLSFSELLLGFTGDPDSRLAPIALSPITDASVSIALYPNPAVSIVNVQVNGSTVVKSAQLYDASGKLLMTKKGSLAHTYSFNISALAAGVYRILIETDSGRQVKAFAKQ